MGLAQRWLWKFCHATYAGGESAFLAMLIVNITLPQEKEYKVVGDTAMFYLAGACASASR